MSLGDELNPAQREAVENTSGPLLVLAGAGSGKTRVLTQRIAQLIDVAGVAPWNILAVTFTNKAAEEMRHRIEALVGEDVSRIWIGTFHSICARILRYESESFGLHSNFTIYDEDDRRALMRRVLVGMNLSEQEFPARTVIRQISRAKNAMIDPEQFAAQSVESPHREQLAKVYTTYEQGLRQNSAFDFDDLIVEPVRQFHRCPEVLTRYRERFRHILIDEYQDTNRPQYLLAKLIAENHRNICCVGDDDQSIYQFRGADIRNILDFEKDYPEAVIVRLEQNYRSTATILNAANAVIGHNLDRKGKNLWTAGATGELIELTFCKDDRSEARHTVGCIRKICRERNLPHSAAAILYRTNAQSRVLEEELQHSSMPYTIIGGIRFYERKEIKDLISYLRILVNPADDVSALRVINAPKRGIGESTVQRITAHARQHHIGLLQAAMDVEGVPGLAPRAQKIVSSFALLIRDLQAELMSGQRSLPQIAEQILERTGYLDILRAEGSPEAEARAENLGQLVSRMAEFVDKREEPEATLTDFLEEVALMSAEDEATIAGGALTLMTLHSAKGLEFPIVAIAGLEEDLFPTARAVEESYKSPQPIEEERRLFYVGITRAMQKLLLSCAGWRYVFGQVREMQPSRFTAEIPDELVKRSEVDAGLNLDSPPGIARRSRQRERTLPEPPIHGVQQRPTPTKPTPQGVHYEMDDNVFKGEMAEDGDFLAVGRWVMHPAWGRGRILSREGNGENVKLTVKFGKVTKKVMAAYAQLQPA